MSSLPEAIASRGSSSRIQELTNPNLRGRAAEALARELGAQDLVIFVSDPESGAMLPAPGFPQTMPDGRRWRAFLERCVRQGSHRESLPAPPDGTIAPVLGFGDGSAVGALIGGSPVEADAESLRDLLPLLGPALRNERAAEAAFVHATLARTTAERARAMTAALDGARRELQRALTEVQSVKAELETALTLRDDFVSVASHELRNPIGTLQLQVRSLLRAAQTRPETVNAGWVGAKLQSADRQVVRLVKLVDQLLDVSRITATRLLLDVQETDFAAVAIEVTVRFRESQPDVVILLDAPAPVVGRSDRFRLDQVVTNLISNALKYGEGKPIQVELARRGDDAVLRVTDRGIGIALESQPRIFERFERAVTGRQFPGLGLGLWISREIVEALGGRIAVESAPGQGSTFTVELPLAGPE